MNEIIPDTPFKRNLRACRRIVPIPGEGIDCEWEDRIAAEMTFSKYLHGSKSAGYILSRKNASLPQGTETVFEAEPGEDLTGYLTQEHLNNARVIFGEELVPLHVCTREMAQQVRGALGYKPGGWNGIIREGNARGMKFLWVRTVDVKTARETIAGSTRERE